MKSAVIMADYSKFKLVLLVLVYVVCAYTAFLKFYGSASNVNSVPQPTIDYSVCRKFLGKTEGDAERKDRCRHGVDRANKEAKSKCSQYFTQLTSCQSRTRTPCQTQFSNFENCVNTLLTFYVEEEPKLP